MAGASSATVLVCVEARREGKGGGGWRNGESGVCV